jgi:hypothetical protein
MKANLHSCSPKLYFLPYMQMSKNTFPLIARKGLGLSFQALAKRQNGEFCFSSRTLPDRVPLYLAKHRTESVKRGKSGPDWARTSDPALIKRML